MRAIKRAFSSKATERGWKPKRERDSFFFFDARECLCSKVFESLRKCSKQRTSLFLPRKKKSSWIENFIIIERGKHEEKTVRLPDNRHCATKTK